MNVAHVRRPMACLKTVMRQTRQRMATQRCLATVATLPAVVRNAKVFSGRQRADNEKISRFKIWPQIPSVRSTHADPMPALTQRQIAALDPTGARTRLFSREQLDSAKVGDVLMVSTRTGDPFSGVFIQIRRRGVDTAIQLRGQLMKTGVEMWFKIYSPTVRGIDIVWRRKKRARRARLTYMRKPEHDMGSVDHLVSAWKKEKHTLASKTQRYFGQRARK